MNKLLHTFDLADLKSAHPVDADAFLKRASRLGRKGPATTVVQRAEDGTLEVWKAFGLMGARGKAAPSAATVQRLVEARGMPWSDEFATRTVDYWGSDERVDLDTDIVRQTWDFSQFEVSSPIPFSHEWGELPIGAGLEWEVLAREDRTYRGPALWLRVLFATGELYEYADVVYRMVRAGFLKSGSVGFQPREVIEVRDPEERRRLGLGPYGVIMNNNLLLEFSPCTIGANPGALSIMQRAKAKGLLQADDVEVLRELMRREQVACGADQECWRETDLRIRAMAGILFPDAQLARHDDLNAPVALLREPGDGDVGKLWVPRAKAAEPEAGKCGCGGAGKEADADAQPALAARLAAALAAKGGEAGAEQNSLGEAVAARWPTLTEILSGTKKCPPKAWLEAASHHLGLATAELVEAARADGCPYDDDCKGGDAPLAARSAGKSYGYNLVGMISNALWGRVYAPGSSTTSDILIDEIAAAAGVDRAAICHVLEGADNCPRQELLAAFGSVLGLGLEALLAAARADGCLYGDDVAPAPSDETRAIEERLDRLESVLEVGLVGLRAGIDDSRALIEDIAGAHNASLAARGDPPQRSDDSREERTTLRELLSRASRVVQAVQT